MEIARVVVLERMVKNASTNVRAHAKPVLMDRKELDCVPHVRQVGIFLYIICWRPSVFCIHHDYMHSSKVRIL